MAEYDLTSKMAKYYDNQLMLTFFEFHEAKGVFSKLDLLKARLKVLAGTRMVDYTIEVYRNLHPEDTTEDESVPTNPPEGTLNGAEKTLSLRQLKRRRTDVIAELRELKTQVGDIKVFEKPEVQEKLQSNPTDARELLQYLEKEHGLTTENINTLFRYARVMYDLADFPGASEFLRLLYLILPANDPLAPGVRWGLLAVAILLQEWDNALDALRHVKEMIDQSLNLPPAQLLHQRTWLMHWALFVFFNHPSGKDLLIEWFLYQPAYLNALQTTSPHLLRYLAAGVMTQNYASDEKKQQVLRDLVRVLHMESAYSYSDPVTELVEALCLHYELGGGSGGPDESEADAQRGRFALCRTLLSNDFFLANCVDEFLENARLLLFEIFCRIHRCISIATLSQKLSLSYEEAERWIVNLIRKAGLDARIDSKAGHVIMGVQPSSLHDLVLQRTKNLAFKTQLQCAALEKRLGQQLQQHQQQLIAHQQSAAAATAPRAGPYAPNPYTSAVQQPAVSRGYY